MMHFEVPNLLSPRSEKPENFQCNISSLSSAVRSPASKN